MHRISLLYWTTEPKTQCTEFHSCIELQNWKHNAQNFTVLLNYRTENTMHRISLLYWTTEPKTQCTEFHCCIELQNRKHNAQNFTVVLNYRTENTMHRISQHVKTREFSFLLSTIMYLICEVLSSTILFYVLLFLITFKYYFLCNATKLEKPSLFLSPVIDSSFSRHAFSVTWYGSVYQWIKLNGLQ